MEYLNNYYKTLFNQKIFSWSLSLFFIITLTLMIGCTDKEGALTEISTPFVAEDYVTFEMGNIPIILSVPHGGDLKPIEIADRSCNNAVSVMDEFTIEQARAIMDEFAKLGYKPYLIINKIHRSKMDANRNRDDASCGDKNALAVWTLFHSQIQNSNVLGTYFSHL